MMKYRGWLFWGLLLLALIVVYYQPVIFQEKSSSRPLVENRAKAPTSLNYQPIEADGLALEVGESLTSFEERFGQPVKTFQSGYSFETRVYSFLDDEQYLEINTDGKKVLAIKVIGGRNSAALIPFSIGMTMNDLTSITMIYPNFTLSEKDQSISFELMEEDMNYRPLVAFDNGTFAILYFDQSTSQLFAVSYLDQETLLKLAPYQLTEGKLPVFTEKANSDWETINREKEVWLFSTLNKLRNASDLQNYGSDQLLGQQTSNLLQDMLLNMEDYLTSERMHSYQKSSTDERTSAFYLSANEWTDLLAKKKLVTTASLFSVPVYDPTFTALSWHSDPFLHARFLHPVPEAIGIAFSKQNVVVLMQEEKEGTGESDSSDL